MTLTPLASIPSHNHSNGEAERRRLDMLARCLLQLLGARDPSVLVHSESVAALSLAIAGELGLAGPRLVRMRRAALLHDIGKLAVPDAILAKPGPLTEDELAIVKQHTTWGHRIARTAGLMVEGRWILHHHERPDGRGYPLGLRGNAIPLESRIILVADAYDAITSDRPYAEAERPERALAEMVVGAGWAYDRACVNALESVVERRMRSAERRAAVG
jgi:putative nucleotidyltransferase with HDIG domain